MRAHLLLAAFLFWRPAVALAGDGAAAEALFDAGVEARQSGDYAAACEKFEASNELDPAVGTVLNLADCHEQLGQVATAWQYYREAAEKLPAADGRAEYARDKAAELSPVLPRVTLRWKGETTGQIYLDDKPVPASAVGVPLPLDPGPHTYQVKKDGHEPQDFPITLKQGESIEVQLRLGPAVATGDTNSETIQRPASEKEPSSQRTVRTLGWVSLGVGTASVAVGSVTGLMAINRAGIVDEECRDDFCRTEEGKDAADQGRTLSALSTGTFIAAGVLLGTGITLLLVDRKSKESAQRRALRWAAAPLRGGGALGVRGTF